MDLRTWLEEIDNVFYTCTNQVEDLIMRVDVDNKEVREHPSWDKVINMKCELEEMMIMAYEELEEKYRGKNEA